MHFSLVMYKVSWVAKIGARAGPRNIEQEVIIQRAYNERLNNKRKVKRSRGHV
jgi:hypothetical protein